MKSWKRWNGGRKAPRRFSNRLVFYANRLKMWGLSYIGSVVNECPPDEPVARRDAFDAASGNGVPTRAKIAATKLFEATHLQFSCLQAQEAVAVSIVGHGNSKNMWNGYSEVQICSTTTETQNGGTGESEEEEPQQQSEEQPTLNVMPVTNDVELPFPEGRKGFNVVNM